MCAENRFVIEPSDILSGGVCVCTFQPGYFAGWGSEGVKNNPMSIQTPVSVTLMTSIMNIFKTGLWGMSSLVKWNSPRARASLGCGSRKTGRKK